MQSAARRKFFISSRPSLERWAGRSKDNLRWQFSNRILFSVSCSDRTWSGIDIELKNLASGSLRPGTLCISFDLSYLLRSCRRRCRNERRRKAGKVSGKRKILQIPFVLFNWIKSEDENIIIQTVNWKISAFPRLLRVVCRSANEWRSWGRIKGERIRDLLAQEHSLIPCCCCCIY